MKTTLLGKEVVAEGTMLFKFEKPEGFVYEAGQSIDLTIQNPPETDKKGNTRPFSLVSAPYELYFAIATRMRDSAFKRVLNTMPIGSELSFEGPFGSFTLHENMNRSAVFIAGGIGVTLFRSIIVDATEWKLSHKLTLFYSNRRPEDAPFLEELTMLSEENPNFEFLATMTAMENSREKWTGERGVINEEMIRKYIKENDEPIFYLAGPAGMVSAMRTLLLSMKVSKDDIRTEEFSGYA